MSYYAYARTVVRTVLAPGWVRHVRVACTLFPRPPMKHSSLLLPRV